MNQDKLGGLKERIILHRLLGLSIGALAVFSLAFILIPTLISEASALQSVTMGANWVATSLTLDPDYGHGSTSDTGHGDIAFGNIIPTSSAGDNIGTQRVIKKTLSIESSGKYYSVYLSMSGDSNLLKLNGVDSNIKINPVAGTWDSPTAFSSAAWGFAVPSTTIPKSDSSWSDPAVPEYPTFTQATTFADTSNLGIDLTYTNNSSVYNQDAWVAVPVLGSAQQIWKATTSNNYGFGGENGDNVNNHFDIYYGIMVDSDVLAGTYENQIIYTALASAQNLDEVSNNLLVSERFAANGTTETIKFDLSSSTSGLVKPSQVYAYVVPHDEVLPRTIEGNTETEEDILARLQANLVSDSNYYNTCSFDRTDSSSDIVFNSTDTTITCTMPDQAPIWDGGLTNTGAATDGHYDIWVTIPAYGANYISKTTEVGTNNRVASVLYVGLQSRENQGTLENPDYQPIITQMQEMKGAVCKNTNMWGTITGENATIYDHLGEDGNNQLLAAGADTQGISSFGLTDNRDNRTYNIRRLPDGNCWTINTLALDLASFVGTHNLTPENTDINTVDKTYWDPGESMYNIAYAIDNTVDSTDQTSYFPVASLDYIGVSQNYQYMPSGITGLVWGSYYYDDATTGEKTQSETLSFNNKYTQIPRSARRGRAAYYNWYAATAESVGWDINFGDATDSICPRGWMIPIDSANNTASKSYGKLAYGSRLKDSDGNTPSDSSARSYALRIEPITIERLGLYNGENAEVTNYNVTGYYWTKTATYEDYEKRAYNFTISGGGLNTRANYMRIYGLTIRCINRD